MISRIRFAIYQKRTFCDRSGCYYPSFRIWFNRISTFDELYNFWPKNYTIDIEMHFVQTTYFFYLILFFENGRQKMDLYSDLEDSCCCHRNGPITRKCTIYLGEFFRNTMGYGYMFIITGAQMINSEFCLFPEAHICR